MGNKLIAIFGILTALAFIAVMYGVSTGVLSTGHKLAGDAQRMQHLVINAELEPYNDEFVTGDTVISAIKKFEYAASGTTKYTITVNGTKYGWTSSGYKSYNSSLDPVINPIDSYYATLVVNSNGVVTGIDFN